ncbi:hypothetical protein D9M73_184210 [compost metagenome]
MPAPGQCFVTDAQIAGPGAFGQQTQVVDQHLALAQCIGSHVAAYQHQIGPQLLHQVELALGTVQVARQPLTAAAFEIAKRLKQGDCQAQVGAALADFPRAAGVVEQVVFEDLDPVKARGGNGVEFFRQGTAQGHGGN